MRHTGLELVVDQMLQRRLVLLKYLRVDQLVILLSVKVPAVLAQERVLRLLELAPNHDLLQRTNDAVKAVRLLIESCGLAMLTEVSDLELVLLFVGDVVVVEMVLCEYLLDFFRLCR